MKTLNDLTLEIKNKIPVYREKCIKDLYSGKEFNSFNKEMSEAYIDKIYEISKFQKPIVIFAKDPKDYKIKQQELQNTENLQKIYKLYLKKNNLPAADDTIFENQKFINKSHYLFLCSSYHRVYLTWYKFIQDEFKIDHKNKEILDWLYENANNNISRCFFTKIYVLVLRMPKRIFRNTIGFHNISEGAIQWENYSMYYINGRRLPEDLFKKTVNNTLTFDEFIQITDENLKGSIITLMKERFGNEYLMNFLNAVVVDEKEIKHSSGYSETVRLFKTKQQYPILINMLGENNQPYAWLELKCPSTNSIFLIDTSAHFTDAIEACKFHRPQQIPSELKYDFNSFNN